MRALTCTWLTLIALLCTRPARGGELPDLSVDLHAHLFMKSGLGWFFEGGFGEPLRANSWDDRLSSKANATTLDDAGVGIMVVALFAHPLYRADVRASVREQLAQAKRFAAQSPKWEIARSPAEAERILRAGKRALVLSLEGAGGVLESEEDLGEFIDEGGISIVTPLHLVDDRFGGAATLNGYQYVANPLNLVDQLLDAHCHDGVETNRQGLSPLGERLAVELVRRGVWLDLTHASDRSLATLVPIAEAAKQPLLFTHTTLRAHRPTERALSAAMLARVAKSDGIIGLLPSDDALETITPRFCPPGCEPTACAKGLPAFATMYQHVGQAIGFERVMLGSDFNGGMRHLSASCGTKNELEAEAGFFHLGQTPLVWQSMRELGASVPPARTQIRAFLDAWAKVEPMNVTIAGHDLPPLPARADVEGPGGMLTLGVGLSTVPSDGMPGLVVRLDGRVVKDVAAPTALEPFIYFAHVDGDAALSPDEGDAPYASLGLSAFGVGARWFDNHAEAEALRGVFRRNVALDQRYAVTAAALAGRVRTMPGILKVPGTFNFYLELGIDVLGYEFLRHVGPRPDLHGVYIGGGDFGLGVTAYPGDMLVSLGGTLGGDFTIVTSLPSLSYQSDVAFGGGLTLGTRDGSFQQRTTVVRYLNVESDLAAALGDTQVRGTFEVAF